MSTLKTLEHLTKRFFFGGFPWTGMPALYYFPAASNGVLGARRPDLAGKFARTRAGKLDGLAGDHLYGKLLFTWPSLVVSVMVSFCAVLFPTRCLGFGPELN